ncbi:hypothetical protein CYMTET_11250 [Cymbomonas tetramitiformis]|uniref:Uncharacterized protein n=1 Tax=Cymbomonas tetramitiformis TaxID=36881 RepID=A0AAE0GMW3_9CHLO|nr:hypothetical protein CYMTET_11250 [Cymbomonas tetramitiformis]
MLEVEAARAEMRKAEAALISERSIAQSREIEDKKLAAKVAENDKQRAHELSIMHMLACAMAGQAPPPLAPTPRAPVVTPTHAAPTTEDTTEEPK